ncbi:MAG: aminotransferase class V-fold PLP-dependent enzyme [Clostridia bacterium]|nr:aminotransferase class V-fold PLP-dependent enzyme [Clostridia bacterium]
MATQKIIYFDNAATTYPKPESVLCATEQCIRYYCGNAGRGAHTLAMRSAETVFEAREKLADMFVCNAENVVFTLNTTYALNMAIKGIVGSRGGHVLISNMEHNSVLRPIAHLAAQKKLTYDIFEAYSASRRLTAKDILASIIKKLRPDTRAVVCTHASNVCSYSLPISEIGAFCRRHGLLFVVDAAQSAGHLPIDMKEYCIDVLCMPAHKGLYAPQGLGIMLTGDGITLDTLIEGGNGVNSLDLHMGAAAPERYEGGTLCTPAIAGLCASLDFVRGIGIRRIHDYECALWRRAFDQLSVIDGVRIYAPEHSGSVLLFNLEGKYPDDVGRDLSSAGFCLRTGYHCAPLAHKALGTGAAGALRIGFGLFNGADEVDALCEKIKNIAAQ